MLKYRHYSSEQSLLPLENQSLLHLHHLHLSFYQKFFVFPSKGTPDRSDSSILIIYAKQHMDLLPWWHAAGSDTGRGGDLVYAWAAVPDQQKRIIPVQMDSINIKCTLVVLLCISFTLVQCSEPMASTSEQHNVPPCNCMKRWG